MLEGRCVEAAILFAELQQVQRGKVAGRVVEEHVFRAGVGCADRARLGAGVPVVDGGVELDAGVSRCPGRVADAVPEFAGFEGLGDLAVLAGEQLPILVFVDGVQEFVGDADRVVRVLAGNGQVGFAVPVGIVDGEVDVLEALLGELDDAQDIVVGHVIAACVFDGALQGRVAGRFEACVAFRFAVDAGLHDGLEALLADLGAGDEGGDLLLFADFPVHVFFDVGMVDVDDAHFSSTARGAARFDGTGCAVTDLEEAHQTRRAAAARQAFVGAAQG